ncbi:MAG: TspO/MBR family protein [Velocimicrobium sp.]
MKLNVKLLISSIAISLGVGALAGLLTMNSMEVFQTLEKPPLTPAAWVFPVVWTILYILMGISAYLISVSDNADKERALRIYWIQLFLNFLWPIVFFTLEEYLLAFFILVLLWIVILSMIRVFWKINPLAAKLQIPYLLWVTFAGYLNLAIYFLNK